MKTLETNTDSFFTNLCIKEDACAIICIICKTVKIAIFCKNIYNICPNKIVSFLKFDLI